MYIYPDEPYCGDNCNQCNSYESKLENVKYWLEYLMDQIYSKSTFDEGEFENCLEELCDSVDMKLPKEQLCITRKNPAPSASNPVMKEFDIEGWKTWNNEYLKQLVS